MRSNWQVYMRVDQKAAIPILTYHSIDESGSVISTGAGVFAGQMQFLKRSGFNVVTLRDLAAALADGKAIPAKTVVLTFDDGFRNFYTAAFPVLQECGFGATVFLVTSFCGGYNDWPGNPPELPRSELLSWAEIKELDAYGVEFGSHTCTHPDLTAMPHAEVTAEIAASKAVIENALGRQAETFAYPFGNYNAEVRSIAAEHFKAACSTNLGKAGAGSDLFTLERLDTYYLSNQKIFGAIESRSFDGYMLFRHGMRKVRSMVRGS